MDTLAGRLPADTDTRTLRMSQYVRQFDRTPAPDGNSEPPSSYGLGPSGNFLIGKERVTIPDEPLEETDFKNCVPTAMARLAQAWQAKAWDAATGQTITRLTLNRTLDIYEKVSPFRRKAITDPSTDRAEKEVNKIKIEKIEADKGAGRDIAARTEDHNDYGVSLLQALKRWTDRDTKPLDGLLPEADYFLEVEPRNLDQLREAVWRFGGVLLGLALPLSIQLPPEKKHDAQPQQETQAAQAMLGSPQEKDISKLKVQEDWFVPGYGPIADGAPGSLSSHCVAITGYTPRAFYCFSDGLVRTLSEEFVLAYTEECFAVLSRDVLADYADLRTSMQKDVEKLRKQDRPPWMPNFTQRWRGGNIMH